MRNNYSDLFDLLIKSNIENQRLQSLLKAEGDKLNTRDECAIKSNQATAIPSSLYINMTSTCYNDLNKTMAEK